jgi:membrane peptidoglycan carboxypeptidase
MERLRPRSDAGYAQSAVAFLGISMLAGVLLAALALPFVGTAGLTAKAAADDFQALPADIEARELPQRSRMLAADGSLIATFYEENRVSVPVKSVAKVMVDAILAVEDSRFYEHGGVDLRGTLRALIANTQAGGVQQGGSTLTQQYVKNLLIELADGDQQKIAEAREATMTRKLRELKYALEIEKRLTKDEILENYLNIAYFGSGAYGVEAAARYYFSTSANKLTLAQAATLAGIVRSPYTYDPTENPDRALSRRNVVLARMAQVGYVTAEQADEASQQKLGLRVTETRNGCTRSPAPFFCDYVTRVIKNDTAFGKTVRDREDLLLRGGITIQTTLDMKAQKSADKALREYVEPNNKVASALAMVEPGTGKVKALGVNRLYGKGKGKTTVNYATDFNYGGSRGFQVGSTMKVFTAAAAIKEKYGVYYSLFSPYRLSGLPRTEDCDGKGVYDSSYTPRNYTAGQNGRYDLRRGTAQSVNTYFLQLQGKVGLCDVVTMAERVGAHRADGKPFAPVSSFTLGSNEMSPLSLANAYATFAARGVHCDPYAISSVNDRTGKKMRIPKHECEEVVRPEVADVVSSLLRGVMQNGTGTRAALSRPSAGKTGTTNDQVAVWFAGYTPQLATAVWAGHPDGSRSLAGATIGGRTLSDWCGGCLPGPIWRTAMTGALRGEPVLSFQAPDREWVNGRYAPKPTLTPIPLPSWTITRTLPPQQKPSRPKPNQSCKPFRPCPPSP